MKIAYIFRGHARTWEQCHENFFNNVHSVFPGDIFIHAWDNLSSPYGSHWNGFCPLTEHQKSIAESKIDMNAIYKAYQPKVMIVEQDKIKSLGNISDATASRLGLKFMLNASKKILDEALKYDSYDFVFETRMDVNYTTKVNSDEFSRNSLVFADVVVDCVMDFYCVGDVDKIKTKMDFCNHVQKYWYDGDYHTNLYERSLSTYLRDNSISWQKSGMSFSVPRIF